MTKPKNRNPKQTRTTKSGTRANHESEESEPCDLRISDFELDSSFGFRISDFLFHLASDHLLVSVVPTPVNTSRDTERCWTPRSEIVAVIKARPRARSP